MFCLKRYLGFLTTKRVFPSFLKKQRIVYVDNTYIFSNVGIQSYRSITKCNLLPVYPMVMAPHRSFVGYSLILKHLALLLLLSLLVVFNSQGTLKIC